MLADGDMMVSHSWSHPNMTSLSPSSERSQLERIDDAIRRRAGFTPACGAGPTTTSTRSWYPSPARSDC